MQSRRIVIAALFVAALAACAPPFSRQLLDQVDRTVDFAALQREPGRYTGKVVMFGGIIVEARNLKEGSQLEVLQQGLDGEGRPVRSDETAGRFLIVTERFLDAAVFHRGREVTVIGEVAGQQTLPLGQIEYRYPVIRARDIHLWSPYSGPHFSIGIGVYHGF
jgi:outer membrane lipoprotein